MRPRLYEPIFHQTAVLMRFPLLPLALSAALLLAACDTGDPGDAPAAAGVLVVNQGNFSQGNGTVSSYSPADGTSNPAALTGFASTLQSALVVNGRLFVAADKAGRLDRFAAATLARDGAALPGLKSARYLATSATRLYATSIADTLGGFSGGALNVLGADGTRIVRRIALPMAAEGVAVAGGKAYVALHGFGAGRDVAVVAGDRLERILTGVCDGPRSVFADDEGDVNVVCTGATTYDASYNVTGTTNGAIVVIDGATGAVEARVALPAQAGAANSGQDAFFDPSTDVLFVVVGQAVHTFSTTTNTLAAAPLVAETTPIGAVAYDAARKQLHVARYPAATPFTLAGTVAVYTVAGSLAAGSATATALRTYGVGIAPTFIALR